MIYPNRNVDYRAKENFSTVFRLVFNIIPLFPSFITQLFLFFQFSETVFFIITTVSYLAEVFGSSHHFVITCQVSCIFRTNITFHQLVFWLDLASFPNHLNLHRSQLWIFASLTISLCLSRAVETVFHIWRFASAICCVAFFFISVPDSSRKRIAYAICHQTIFFFASSITFSLLSHYSQATSAKLSSCNFTCLYPQFHK